ncbi:MAG: hypothetical protein ACLTG4_13185 [Oscillospiraceae bacterium]
MCPAPARRPWCSSLIPALEAGISGHARRRIRSVSAEGIAHVKLIDATPIGINVRSTVATYAGVHDELRKLYADRRMQRRAAARPAIFPTTRARCVVPAAMERAW